jgi:hypothetical protein
MRSEDKYITANPASETMIVPTRGTDLGPPGFPVGLGPVLVFVPVEETSGPEGETASLVYATNVLDLEIGIIVLVASVARNVVVVLQSSRRRGILTRIKY